MDPEYYKVQWIHHLHQKPYCRMTAAANRNCYNHAVRITSSCNMRSTIYTTWLFGDHRQGTKCHTLGTRQKHTQTLTYHNAVHPTSTPQSRLTTSTSGRDWRIYNEYNDKTLNCKTNAGTFVRGGAKEKANTPDTKDGQA